MKTLKLLHRFCLIFAFILISACGLNPQTADTDLNVTLPEAKVTVYSKAVRKIGLMSNIYGAPPLRLMAKDIVDNTGTSVATSAEIPRDITEMVKSTLNGIGGNITFIPYEPDFMQNTVITGYTEYEHKLVPDVVVTGGITEFDRGLVTKGDSFEADIEYKEYGIEFADQNKASLASVTLDFNLIDFQTFAGIPRVQAINGIKLHKGVKEDSLGFTIKSATFGAKGSIKKVQGRHAAVRLLVEISMIQIIGRQQKLPYWRLLPGAKKDDVVIDQVLTDFYDQNPAGKVADIQSLLYLHGYTLQVNGTNDSATRAALQQFASKKGVSNPGINEATYLALFENVPIELMTLSRRKTMGQPSPDQLATAANYSEPEYSPAAYSPPPPVVAPPPAAPAPAPAPAAVVQADTGELKLWTNKSDFRIGEQLQINFSVDQPMYVRIVVINSEGHISTLFPNVYQSDNYIKPNKVYQVPPLNADFTLDIGAPSGTDKIRAVASKNPIPSEAMHFTTSGDFDEAKMARLNIRAASNIVIR